MMYMQRKMIIKNYGYVLLTVLALACAIHPVHAGTRHVWQDSPNPSPPYADWASAATNIQDAVDAALGATPWW